MSFLLSRNLSIHIDRQARTCECCDTVLDYVRVERWLVGAKHCRGWGDRGKGDRKQITLTPLGPHVQYLNSRSHGQILSSTSGKAEFAAH